MKQIVTIVMVFALSCLMISCAKRSTTINTPEGKVEIQQQGNTITLHTKEGKAELSQEGKSVTVESEKGKMTIGKLDAMPKDLGVPVYPGASQEGSMTMTGSAGHGENNTSVVLTTKDPFDKVVAYYKEQLSSAKTTNVTTPDNSMAMFELEKDGKMLHVSIVSDKKKEVTTISIVKQEKEKKE